MSNLTRAEIIIFGMVQGVGFRYFVFRAAEELGVKGFAKNLYSGEVQCVVEGELGMVKELIKELHIGPRMSNVKTVDVKWKEFQNEFNKFEIRY